MTEKNQVRELLLLNPVCTHNIWGGSKLREMFGYPVEGDDLTGPVMTWESAGESPPTRRGTGLSAAGHMRGRRCPGSGRSIRSFSGTCPMTGIPC